MRPLYLFIVILSLSLNAAAQSRPAARTQKTAAPAKPVNAYAAIDAKALQVPEEATATTAGIAAYINASFTKPVDKVRAAFIWTASSLQYDLDNMFALNFHEKREEKIARSLKTRKGICENYAAIFNDICNKAGIRAFVVEGYTRQNGFTDYIPHAWCAAYVDTAWFLFDPTWGSGYVVSGKFVKKINNEYFLAAPRQLVKSHMPFDYLWQLLHYPVTTAEFYEGKTEENTSRPFFSYADSIAVFEKQDEVDYYAAAASRMERNGVRNSLAFDRLQQMRRAIDIEMQNRVVHLYNTASVNYNNAVNSFNTFIDYRNKQFKPEKTDPQIQAMLDESADELKNASLKLARIKNPDANTASLITGFNKQIGDLSARIDEQQEWLKKYFSKGKAGRRSMFTKYSWFGIPLN
ncbi:transglutaminase domain-containing protein [Chitinophaga sp.]|uniref:transglutaminase domain-containing protein n=1 Tax=Chitinophaga sp. TaxID=1869181 RepID=UPI0031DD064F